MKHGSNDIHEVPAELFGQSLYLATHPTDFRKILKARTAKVKAIKRSLVLLS